MIFGRVNTLAPVACIKVIAGILIPLIVSGCDTLREQAGLTKQRPDEFAVVTKAPLTLPPDFKLRPPRPGEKRPQEKQPAAVARAALIGKAGTSMVGTGDLNSRTAPGINSKTSVGEAALLRQAGASNASKEIRNIVNKENAVLSSKDNTFAKRLMFWKQSAGGVVVDASKEARRIREVEATGQKYNEGKVPVIRRRQRGLLEDIFK